MRNQYKRNILSERNRFDFEQDILKCWSTKDDLELFLRIKLDSKVSMTEDEEANALIGIIQLHDMRMLQAWETMEHLIKIRSLT